MLTKYFELWNYQKWKSQVAMELGRSNFRRSRALLLTMMFKWGNGELKAGFSVKLVLEKVRNLNNYVFAVRIKWFIKC